MKLEVAGTSVALFMRRSLPWFIGAGGLILFLITLNHWVSLQSLPTVARVSNWLWRPELNHPLTFALLLPFRLLPEASIPLALNLVNALCAALVLVLLARSVLLLPQDVALFNPTRDGVSRKLLAMPNAWVPPLLASILCACQLSFWEHATSVSGEMLDLLVFAYVIRCVLEFRLDRNQSWLSRAAFLYAAGMTNDWALVAFFPVFVVALVRVKTVSGFFERGFLWRMLLWGLSGYSTYLLVVLIQGSFFHTSADFWAILKGHAKSQREVLGYFRKPAFVVLAVAALLPLLVLSIRWKSHTVQIADDTRVGVFFTKATGHLLHGLLLLGSLWLAFDPTFSPRHLALGPSMLTYYYLSALVFGYCAGYFSLLGHTGRKAEKLLPKQIFRLFAIYPMYCLILLLPCLLASRNLPQLRLTNGPMLREYARDLYADLPSGSSAVLCEQPMDLLLLQAELIARHHDKNVLLLDAPGLAWPEYHAFIGRHLKAPWALDFGDLQEGSPGQRSPKMARAAVGRPPVEIGAGRILHLLSTLASHAPVFFLYPSFGPLFELFKGEPEGCLHRLQIRASITVEAYLPSALQVEIANARPAMTGANEYLWQRRWAGTLRKLSEQRANQIKCPPGFKGTLLRWLLLPAEQNKTATAVGVAYSTILNCWAVEMQRLSRDKEAEVWFQRALQLNPDNLTAHINLEFAQRKRRGETGRLNIVAIQNQFSELFARYDNWRQILGANGPVDEPSFLLRTGRILIAGGNIRQSIPELTRAAELAPDWPQPKLSLAEAFLLLKEFSAALAVTDRFKSANLAQDGPALSQLLECRVRAFRGLGLTNEAETCINDFTKQFNQHNEVLLVAAELEARNNKLEASLALVDQLLEREPKRPDLLARKGMLQLQLSRYDEAIGSLTAALYLKPQDDDARLCRAIAFLGVDRLEAARTDYQELLKSETHSSNALFGLGTIAWRQQETNSAIQFYQRYLSSRVSDNVQTALASERLNQLRPGTRNSTAPK